MTYNEVESKMNFLLFDLHRVVDFPCLMSVHVNIIDSDFKTNKFSSDKKNGEVNVLSTLFFSF